MVQGVSALHARFQKIPDRVIKAASATLEKYAARIVADMQRLVPVDDGALRASIGWTWGDAPSGSLTIGSVRGNEFGTLRITIYAGNETTKVGKLGLFNTAIMQEFGTKAMAANPYFYPAYRANKRAVKGALTRSVRKAIREG